MRKLFTKKLKGAGEILIGCWTVSEGEHEHSIHFYSLLQREGRNLKRLTGMVRKAIDVLQKTVDVFKSSLRHQ